MLPQSRTLRRYTPVRLPQFPQPQLRLAQSPAHKQQISMDSPQIAVSSAPPPLLPLQSRKSKSAPIASCLPQPSSSPETAPPAITPPKIHPAIRPRPKRESPGSAKSTVAFHPSHRYRSPPAPGISIQRCRGDACPAGNGSLPGTSHSSESSPHPSLAATKRHRLPRPIAAPRRAAGNPRVIFATRASSEEGFGIIFSHPIADCPFVQVDSFPEAVPKNKKYRVDPSAYKI